MKSIFTHCILFGAFFITPFTCLKAQSKLSPMTQIMLSDYQTVLKAKSLTKSATQSEQLSVFVRVADESGFSLIEEHGGTIQTIAGNICTALIPVGEIKALSLQPSIISINAAIEVKPALDVARVSSRNNLVNSGQAPLTMGYTGSGVVVGVIDTGIDFSHPTFYSDASMNTYRIKNVWNQNAKTGTNPSGYKYGAEYTTKEAMLAAGSDNKSEDHGTHTSAIAAGSGYSTAYKGIATGSDLYLVGTNMTNTGIIDGVNYIISKSKQAGKPCVINLSLGSHVGPHDGTSDFDQMLAEKVGPGVIVVGAAGNEGEDPIHVRTSGANQLSTVIVPNLYTSATTYMISDIWGNAGQNYQVKMGVYNTTTGALIQETPWINANANPDGSYYGTQIKTSNSTYLVQLAYSLNPNNHKYNITAVVQGAPFVRAESIVISINPLNNHFVDMWATNATYSNALGFADMVAGNSDYTVGEVGGVAADIVTVGAYVTKRQWAALNGNGYQYGPDVVVGNIAPFSSKGPTADGRIKPDIAAPGCGIVSAVNHYSSVYNNAYPFSVATNTIGTTNYYWGLMQGTSMAAPLVAGSLALWLEADPNLTQQQVKQIFATTSKQNASERIAYPNNTWGQGILDSYAGIVDLMKTVDVPETEVEKSILVYPNPVIDNCNIQVSANNKVLRVELSDISGRRVFARNFSGNNNSESVSLASLPRGIYVINIQTNLGVKSEKVVLK